MKRKKLLVIITILLISVLGSCSNKENLKSGKYVTDDGFAWVVLQDNNEFVFNRNIATSYDPIGSYSIENGELILHVTDEEEYIFRVKDNQLIFLSGGFAESFIDAGTIFIYTSE